MIAEDRVTVAPAGLWLPSSLLAPVTASDLVLVERALAVYGAGGRATQLAEVFAAFGDANYGAPRLELARTITKALRAIHADVGIDEARIPRRGR